MAKIIDLRKEFDEQTEGLIEILHRLEEKREGFTYYREENFTTSFFIGSVFNIFPSGKYYMPWCSNQTWKDEVMDHYFNELLEEKLKKENYWIESGEGDLCDIFFVRESKDQEIYEVFKNSTYTFIKEGERKSYFDVFEEEEINLSELIEKKYNISYDSTGKILCNMIESEGISYDHIYGLFQIERTKESFLSILDNYIIYIDKQNNI